MFIRLHSIMKALAEDIVKVSEVDVLLEYRHYLARKRLQNALDAALGLILPEGLQNNYFLL